MIYPTRDFEKASCRDAAIDKTELIRLFDTIEDQQINLHSIVLLRDGAKVFDVYADGFGPSTREEVYSIAKSFTAIAIGICQDKGYLQIDQPVISFFRDQVKQHLAATQQITIKHLLTMSVGHSKDYFFELDRSQSLIETFFQLPIDFTPGTHFVYNNFASWMLSAIVSQVTGLSLNDFLDETLYRKIGIVKPQWQSLQGVSLGGYGLSLGALDLARFGHLLLCEGTWKGEVIVSRAFVREATSSQISTSHLDDPKDRYGYGYQFWMNDFQDYRAAGMFKQYIIINKEFNCVFVVQAYENRDVLDLFTTYILSGFIKGWQYTYHSLRDVLYRFSVASKTRIDQEKQIRKEGQ